MDDHITGSILKENTHSVAAMQSLSAETYHFQMKSGAEAGTAARPTASSLSAWK